MINVISNTLLITSFVLTMMLIIEYINIKTSGSWSKRLSGSRFSQLILAVVLGIIPGCMGTYTIVSLYTHNIVSFGALVASFIATSGDEAFIMLSIIPKQSIIIFAILTVIAIVVGILVDVFFKKKSFNLLPTHNTLPIHEMEVEFKLSTWTQIKQNFAGMSFARGFLLLVFALAIAGIFLGAFEHSHDPGKMLNMPEKLQQNLVIQDSHAGHDHGPMEGTESSLHHDGELPEIHAAGEEQAHNHGPFNWLNITLLLSILVAMYIIISVPDHFLEEHVYGHILKKHFFKILLWTFGTLLFIHYAIDFLQLDTWMQGNLYWVLIIALLVGLIPESGPHLIFLSLYVGGVIPISILIANSVVQDGHGALPLLAESQKSFIWAKLINFFVGLVVGVGGLLLGF
ncbi:MAG: arsenic efflux protein [Bacteroidales bacterium]|nr:arsenic efflux protein [Bacteroidales bacterium]